MTNYFDFYELPRSPKLDEALLRSRYLLMSKRYHPDFFTLESPEKQAEMLELSTLNNQAYQVLSEFEPRLIGARIDQLGQTLRCDEREHNNGERIEVEPIGDHAAARVSVTVLKVKPGPNAISNDCCGRPSAIAHSSTKSAVGADMLP